jgi:hypothetical protein
MNTVKNVLFFGLLLVGLGGVYLALNRSPESNTLPPGLDGRTTPPKIEIPGLTGPPPSVTSDMNSPPSFPSAPPTMSLPPRDSGGTAPAFQPSTTAGSESIAPPFPAGSNATAVTPPAPAASSPPPGVRDPFALGGGTTQAATMPTSPSVSSPTVSLPPPPSERTPATIEQTMQQVKLDLDHQRFGDALLNLSQLYGNPDLPMPSAQARDVTLILDQMAAKVIYSRENWLENPYLVQSGDTLDIVADRYRVPALLLARINCIRDPQNLPPGKPLKVLKGPFSAYISTDRSEMTLMLDGRYAGRFSLVLSSDLGQTSGFYSVREKRPPATAGHAPGKQWIELTSTSGNITLQGTNDTRIANGRDSRATVWLSEQDMDDVFGILSVGSRVIIQR